MNDKPRSPSPRTRKEDGSTFQKFFCFETVQTAPTEEEKIRASFRELALYIVYLIVLLIGAFGMMNTSMFYYAEVMRQLFLEKESELTSKSFQDCVEIEDIWSYMTDVFVPNLFLDMWYKPPEEEDFEETASPKHLMYENKILGYPRIRQVRVRSDSCDIHREFEDMFDYCYAPYSHFAEDKDPFPDETVWLYASQKELDVKKFWGTLATYGGGGYYQDIPLNDVDDALSVILLLRKSTWIRRGTRAVFVDFTTYNANVNLFCVVKLIFELPPTGGVVPNWRIKPVKLIRYVSIFDYFVLSAEFMFLIFTVYYTVEEIREIIFFKWAYLKHLWNIIDMILLGNAYACVLMRIYQTIKVHNDLGPLLEDQKKHVNFENLGYLDSISNDILAILVFFAFLKILKYLSFNKTMIQLKTTLYRCLKDVSAFSLILFIVFFAFVISGLLLFGDQVEDFSTFIFAVFTLLRAVLGEFDYERIRQSHPLLGPVYFMVYIVFVFFLLLNMFLAIITDAYTEVKSDRALGNRVSMFIKRGINNLFKDMKCKKPDKYYGKLTTKKVRKLLRESDFNDLEIDAFFAKYGIGSEEKELDEAVAERILNDLDTSTVDDLVGTSLQPGSSVTTAEFNGLKERVELLEQEIEDVIERVDSMLKDLEEITEAPGGD